MQNKEDWQGVYVVAVTPFEASGAIDEPSFRLLLETYIADGVDGIIIAGSTGEWYTLEDGERLRLFEIAVEVVGDRSHIIAGTSAISTTACTSLTRCAGEIGCQGAMVLPPPYALPNHREVVAHFSTVAGVGVPVMVYNNPARTQINLAGELLEDIATIDGVVALKDSSKDLYQIAETVRNFRSNLAIFSGLEPYAMPTILRGGVGVVSMSANIIGSTAVDFFRHIESGQIEQAVEIEHKLDRIYAAFYAGGYGVYVVIKECMNILGRPGGFPRPPHLPIDNKGRKRLTQLMSELGFVE